MEADDSFFLTKKNFPDTTSSLIRNLLTDEDFTDVTLACSDNRQVKAHRVVLSASSKFFNNVLKMNKGPNLVLYLKGVNHGDLKSLIEFIYSGQTNVQKNSLNSFLEAAEELKIEGLVPRKPVTTSITSNTSTSSTLEQEGNSSTASEESQEPSSLSSLTDIDTDFSTMTEEDTAITTITELTMEDVDSSVSSLESSVSSLGDVESSVSSLLSSASGSEELTFNVTPEFSSTLLPTPAQKAEHKCEDCDKTFTAAWSVKRHQMAVHRDGKKKEVEDGMETGGDRVKVEIAEIEEQKPRIFPCDMCDFTTAHKTSLKRHLLMVHKIETPKQPENSAEKKFGCEHCQFRTSHETSLKRHVKTIHE